MDPKSLIGITYLANAEITCPEKHLLSGFQFENLNNKKFRYSYECTNLKRNLTADTVYNTWTGYLGWVAAYADSNGDVNFLDRQHVDCSGKGFLASVLMEVDHESKQLRYIYQCSQVISRHLRKAKCEDRRTTRAEAEHYFLPALRHHHVQCEEGEVLKSFVLQVDYDPPHGHVWYSYSCCQL